MERTFKIVFTAAAALAIAAVGTICLFLIVEGTPAFGKIGLWRFLAGCSWRPGEGSFGILPMLAGSAAVTAGAVVLGVPVGILTAVFLAAFSPRNIERAVRPAVTLMAGIPSVVYGFFGMMTIVPIVRSLFGGRGMCTLSASVLLAMMILPTIIVVAESALRAVPRPIYEGALVWGAAALTVAMLLAMIANLLVKGLPNLKPSLFAWTYTSANASLLPAAVNTLTMTVIALAVALPAGVGAAVYLVEYAQRGNRFVGLVRIAAETLAGIPSIVYGLFGAIFFVRRLGCGKSILAGALTLAVMILPLVLRTAEEALKAVPDLYREGSFGLGAGRVRTVFAVILPAAAPGLFAGVLLSIGRIIGESAALVFTSGTVAQVAQSLFDSGRTLSVHLYAISGEGLYVGETYATSVVLLVFVIALNAFAHLVERKFLRRSAN